MVANRTREIRPSGMRGGACGNVGYGGTRNPSHKPKGCVSVTLRLRLRTPYIYPTAGALGNRRSYRERFERYDSIMVSEVEQFQWRLQILCKLICAHRLFASTSNQERACFKGSGLPMPSKGFRFVSFMSILIRCNIFLSVFCQKI